MSVPSRELPLSVTFAGLRIEGVSVAGRETWFHLPALDLAFDLGRAPSSLVPVPNVFLSHAHLDHGAGLAYWFSQRKLHKLEGGVVRTDASAVENLRRIVSLHEELERVAYGGRIEAMAPGDRVGLRKDLEVSAFRVDHRIPSLGFLASETRNKLSARFHGKDEGEIRAAIARGESVSERVAIPLVAYSGDTAAGFFDLAPKEVFRAKVLLLECSFVDPRDRHRSGEWKHLHLDEIAERADLFENEALVLVHLSLRTTPDEIRRYVKERLPASLASRTLAFLPD